MAIFMAGVLVGAFAGCLVAILIMGRLLKKAEPRSRFPGELFESARDFSEEVRQEL